VGVHVFAGAATGLVGRFLFPLEENVWFQTAFVGVLGSQVLLLGIWAGFATIGWPNRSTAILAGVAWLSAVTSVIASDLSLEVFVGTLIVAGVPLLLVAASCSACRRLYARVERRNQWPDVHSLGEFRYSIKRILGLTFLVASVLSLARFFHWIGYIHLDSPLLSTGVFASIVMVTSLLSAGLLLWSSLGLGSVAIRLPPALLLITLVGLLPPYFMKAWEFDSQLFLTWPALMAVGRYHLGDAARRPRLRLSPRADRRRYFHFSAAGLDAFSSAFDASCHSAALVWRLTDQSSTAGRWSADRFARRRWRAWRRSPRRTPPSAAPSRSVRPRRR
jgi:hypothetical protein